MAKRSASRTATLRPPRRAWPPAPPADEGNLLVFPDCPNGGGIPGHWIVDGMGLPAFQYELNQLTDARVSWHAQLGADRRDHFILKATGA